MAILDEKTLEFTSNSVEQTQRLGVRLGELLQPGDVVCLAGELGSGKTCLAQGIGRGWGAAGRVTSPSYTLVNAYPRLRDNRLLYHLDGYRLEQTADVATAGLTDVLDEPGAFMVEWPERLAGLLPDDALRIELRFVSPTRRGLRMKAGGERAADLLRRFRQSAFGV